MKNKFIFGFEPTQKLSTELNNYENERLVSRNIGEIERSFCKSGGRKMKKAIIPAAALFAAIFIELHMQTNRKAEPSPVNTPTPLRVEVTAAPPKMEIMVTEIEEPDVKSIVPTSASLQIPTSSPTATPTTAHTPTPSPTAAPVVSKNVQSEERVYVKGFGWLESQGGNTGTYAEDMYENGNKVGIMD